MALCIGRLKFNIRDADSSTYVRTGIAHNIQYKRRRKLMWIALSVTLWYCIFLLDTGIAQQLRTETKFPDQGKD
jgi:hypothetical protein